MTRLSLIAALDRDRGIGRGNELPWRLPDDLKRFKALTLGKPVLMGRKTAQSLGRALPGRRNLVLTRSGEVPYAGMQAVASVEAALAIAVEDAEFFFFVMGCCEIYSLCLPAATHMHLTYVDTAVADADAHFPRFDAEEWRVTARERHGADDRHAFEFEFVDYVRLGMDA